MTPDQDRSAGAGTVDRIAATAPPPRRRVRLVVVVSIVVVALLVAAFVATRDSDDSGPRSTGPTLPEPSTTGVGVERAASTLGFYTGSPNTHGLDEFVEREEWLGRPIASFTAYGEGSSVDGFRRNATAQFREDRLGQWVAAGEKPPFQLVYMLPLAFGEGFGQDDDVADLVEDQWDALIDGGQVDEDAPHAAGLDLDFYREFAFDLAELGYGDAIIRLGSEHDIQGSRWASEIDYDKFKDAYRAVVDVMRAEAPDLSFDFTSILLNFGTGDEPGAKVTDAYPGDDYVDYIGIDVYDQGEMPSDIGVASGDRCGWKDPAAVFETYHRPAMETARAYAVARGKPISLPEWGLSGGGRGDAAKQEGQCGGDNPVFVEKMHGWLSSLPASGAGSLGYHAYFEGNPAHDGPHALAEFPEARARFRTLFGSS